MRRVPLSEIKDLSRFLREAEGEEIVITRNGQPAGVLMGFASEDDWLDYRVENDPRFLRRIEQARKSLSEGRRTKIEDLETDLIAKELTLRNFEKETKEPSVGDRSQSLTLKASLSWEPQNARLTRSALDEDPPGMQQPKGREQIDPSNVISSSKRAA